MIRIDSRTRVGGDAARPFTADMLDAKDRGSRRQPPAGRPERDINDQCAFDRGDDVAVRWLRRGPFAAASGGRRSRAPRPSPYARRGRSTSARAFLRCAICARRPIPPRRRGLRPAKGWRAGRNSREHAAGLARSLQTLAAGAHRSPGDQGRGRHLRDFDDRARHRRARARPKAPPPRRFAPT